MNVVHLSTLGTRWAVWHVAAQERGMSVCSVPGCSASRGPSGEGLGGFHTLSDWNYPLMKASKKKRSQESSAGAALQQTLKPASACYFPHSYSPQLQGEKA